MASDLNYQFDREQIEKSVYAPRLHSMIENELTLLRRAAIQMLTGQTFLKTAIVPQNETAGVSKTVLWRGHNHARHAR
jgi:hypothetical protein